MGEADLSELCHCLAVNLYTCIFTSLSLFFCQDIGDAIIYLLGCHEN